MMLIITANTVPKFSGTLWANLFVARIVVFFSDGDITVWTMFTKLSIIRNRMKSLLSISEHGYRLVFAAFVHLFRVRPIQDEQKSKSLLPVVIFRVSRLLNQQNPITVS